eukprot:Seg1471.1 transcript_id=Seg1471.1/GoldUCD/mRNA.D3Y31 product="hypothetical protein" protein_id=Seg1471.1/GoldUCD/D3Y31
MEIGVMRMILFLATVLIAMTQAADVSTSVLDECKYKVEPVGCYKDDMSKRTMPIQIINGRDTYSNVFDGRAVQWTEYQTYIQGFICRCAEKAFAKGYKMIGIQYYAECWSGPDAHKDYKKLDSSKNCINGDFKYCQNKAPVCSGKDATNYVYRIAPDCDVNYEPVGCMADNDIAPRPIPEYIMNERDYKSGTWNGRLIDWRNWDTYSPGFICRCAKAVKAKGYTTFGAQFYGECWSGAEDKLNIRKDGASEKCIAEEFKPCPYNSYHCVGKDHANQVYKIIEAPKEVTAVNNSTRK